MASHCADCTACCTVFEIDEISKAFGEPCKHLGATSTGPGCTIYEHRPGACSRYVCLWLDAERRNQSLGEDLRPNVSKVVLGWPWGIERDVLHVYPLPGHDDAWRTGKVAQYLRAVLARGGRLMIVLYGGKRIAIRGDMAVVGTEKEFEELFA